MTKNDFIDWKRHPVTQQVFSQLSERIESLSLELVAQVASADPRAMAEKAGAIQAFQHILEIEFEEETQ